MDPSFWINLAMAVIAVLACVFAGLSARRAKEANRIAKSANEIAESAQTKADKLRSDAIWDDVELNLNWLLSFDYVGAAKPIDEVLVPTRFRLMKLAEHIDRPEVSEWLQADWRATSHNIAAVMETPLQVDRKDFAGSLVKANEPAHVWVAALLNNIRKMRADGISPEEAEQLRANAEKMSEKLREQFGWERGPSLQDFEASSGSK